MRQRSFGVELLWRHLGRHDQLDPPVVQDIDQPSEAPGLRGQAHWHMRHIAEQNSMKLRRDFKIVVVRTRATTQVLEIKPDHAASAPPRQNLTRLDLQAGIFVLSFCQLLKCRVHLLVGLLAQGRVVQPELLQLLATVVLAVVHLHHFETGVEQFNRWQDAAAVQAIGVQIIWHEVGGRDKPNAMIKQRLEQPVQDHRIGDVGDVKLIEANQSVPFSDALAQGIERVGRALQRGEFSVDLTHELMKMQPRLASHGDGVKKTIHQKTFAPANATKQVDATRYFRPTEQFFQGVRPLFFVLNPRQSTALKGGYCQQLRRVTGVAPLAQLQLIGIGHRRQGVGLLHSGFRSIGAGCSTGLRSSARVCPPPAPPP